MGLIRHVGTDGETVAADLFGTLAALAGDAVVSFPALRPHQRQPWHAFLVQVAALALHRAGTSDMPETAEGWRDLLLALTPDWSGGEAWALVVDDWARPALLQPPVTKASDKADYKSEARTPDALDMLVTSKNHDLKSGRMAEARDDDWLFALVTLQTYEGFMGAGNFGVSRMNGGFGSRLAFGVRPSGRPGAAWRRDVLGLLAARAGIVDAHPGLADDGLGLLWLAPWDGKASRSFAGLDPFYVEICRRVRLGGELGARRARLAGSKAARIESRERTGRTGDPWAPVLADGTKSVTPTAAGLGYRQMVRLLDPKTTVRPPLAALRPSDAEAGLALVASAVVRGQGKTEGFHERRIPVSARARGLFNTLGGAFLDRAGGVARARADAAGAMGGCLRRGVFALLMGGADRMRLDDAATDRKAQGWMRLFDARVDAVFFDEAFWDAVAAPGGAQAEAWMVRLRTLARSVLDEAVEAAPRTQERRIKAEAQARDLFEAQAGKQVRLAAEAGETVDA